MNYRSIVVNRLIFLIFIAFGFKGIAQNTDYVIDMNGIGALKIGMRQDEIEKMLKQKLILKNALDTAVSFEDSVTAKYKNINVLLFFLRSYTSEKEFSMYLTGIRTSSALCKTGSGVGIGADRLKIITAFQTQNICMGPEFEDEADTAKSKTKYFISITDDKGERKMVFYLRNKKTIAIEVNTVFNDEE